MVIAPERLVNYMPLYADKETEGMVTQFDMGDVESIGLVKFDLLGLRTLTIVDWAVNSIIYRNNCKSFRHQSNWTKGSKDLPNDPERRNDLDISIRIARHEGINFKT